MSTTTIPSGTLDLTALLELRTDYLPHADELAAGIPAGDPEAVELGRRFIAREERLVDELAEQIIGVHAPDCAPNTQHTPHDAAWTIAIGIRPTGDLIALLEAHDDARTVAAIEEVIDRVLEVARAELLAREVVIGPAEIAWVTAAADAFAERVRSGLCARQTHD